MNPTYHWTRRVRLAPHSVEPDLFDVAVTYAAEEPEQFYKLVHVPAELKALLERDACGFHLETLEHSGWASRLLSGRPMYAVIAVTDQEGRHHSHCPKSWARYRRAKGLVALAASFGAIASFAAFSTWSVLVAGALSHVAAWAWRERRSVAFHPFMVHLQLSQADKR